MAAEQRKKITILRSYRDAAKMLAETSKADACDYLLAILDYGLDDVQPQIDGAAGAMFILTRPNLDTSIKLADGGRNGGQNNKPTESLPEALPEPTKSLLGQESGVNKDNGDKGIGYRDNNPPHAHQKEAGFEVFWLAYPKKVGKTAAKAAYEQVNVPIETLLAALERHKCSEQWCKAGGQYIPNPATWLSQGRWEDELPEKTYNKQDIPKGASGQLGAAELEAIQRVLAEGDT